MQQWLGHGSPSVQIVVWTSHPLFRRSLPLPSGRPLPDLVTHATRSRQIASPAVSVRGAGGPGDREPVSRGDSRAVLNVQMGSYQWPLVLPHPEPISFFL
jgi:hypothetical protein